MIATSAARSLMLAAACVGLSAFGPGVLAQDKMDKPVKILVGFAPGGTADLIARVVADKLKDTIGQPVIVENRPGAAGRIAADAVKAAAPDGATIMVMPIGPMAVVPHTLKAIPFDPIKDFTAIINPPQTTILAVGAGEERAVVRAGKIEAAWMMSVTLSCDHRAVDGALGAQLLGAFKVLIESPVMMVV